MNQFQNNSFIQINPLLYFISNPDQAGWINERYVNLLTYDGIVDYVDNINYSGIFHHVKSYGINELSDFHEAFKNAVVNDQFAVLWVDEYYLSASSHRHNSIHFVHPLIVYGYSEETDQYNVIFFDITKGQVIIRIDAKEMHEAVAGVKEHYNYGATIDALDKTLSVFKPSSTFKGEFHLDVFIKNLSHYLYCIKDNGSDWYNLQRKHLYYSRSVVYGVQIYQVMINELNSPECRINYKTVHDFVKHKRFLYEKLLYIENEYEVSQILKDLIKQFGKHADKLECIRLLNMKYQTKNGYFPASLSFDSEYKAKLKNALEKGYETELDILPKIIQELKSLKYTKKYLSEHHIISCETVLCESEEGWNVKQITFDKSVCSSKIDIANHVGQALSGVKIIIVNDKYRYLINEDREKYGSIYSIDIPVMPIRKIECRSPEPADFTLNIICLPGQNTSSETFDPELLTKYDGKNHIELQTEDGNAFQYVFTGEDPYIYRFGYGIDASHFKYIRIEMKSFGMNKTAQVFFVNSGFQNWSAERMVEFDVVADGAFHTYIVDMQTNSHWTGFIGGLRLDPAHYTPEYPFSRDVLNECTIRNFNLISDMSKE